MSDPFSMTTDMRMLAGIKIKMMTLTIFNGSSIRANLPSRGARGKIKKIITGQKIILEMLEPIKKQQNETQNCVPSDGVRWGLVNAARDQGLTAETCCAEKIFIELSLFV